MAVEERVAYLEAKMEDVGKTMTLLRSDIAALDKKLDERFMWMIGVEFGSLLAIVGGMFAIVATLLHLGRP